MKKSNGVLDIDVCSRCKKIYPDNKRIWTGKEMICVACHEDNPAIDKK